MKRSAYLFWSVLLIASGTLASGEPASTPQAEPLQVRSVVKTHAWGYDVKQAAGSSELVKTREARPDARLSPEIVHIPKPEVSDEE